MTETERMNAGLLYDCSKEEIMGTQTQYVQHMQEYNTLGLGHEKRMEELLKIMFADVGEGTYIGMPRFESAAAMAHAFSRRFMQTGAVTMYIWANLFLQISAQPLLMTATST